MIRGTLTNQGTKSPFKRKTRPTKAYSLLPNPEEKKGIKEAQSTSHVHSAAPPSPLEPAGQSPPRSRAKPCINYRIRSLP